MINNIYFLIFVILIILIFLLLKSIYFNLTNKENFQDNSENTENSNSVDYEEIFDELNKDSKFSEELNKMLADADKNDLPFNTKKFKESLKQHKLL